MAVGSGVALAARQEWLELLEVRDLAVE